MVDRLAEGFAALRHTYVGRLGPEVGALCRNWVLFRIEADSAAAERFRQGIHRLCGSGATFGFPRLSDTAREIEDILDGSAEGGSPLDGIKLARMETLLATLIRITGDIEQHPDEAAEGS